MSTQAEISQAVQQARVARAQIGEKDAELEYLRQRNLNLRVTIEQMSEEQVALQAEIEQLKQLVPVPHPVPVADGSAKAEAGEGA